WFWCRCALMIEAVRKFTALSDPRAESNGEGLPIGRVLAFHVVLLISLFAVSLEFNRSSGLEMTALSVLVAYGFVFLYGLASLTIFMAALRAIAEHSQDDDGTALQGYT